MDKLIKNKNVIGIAVGVICLCIIIVILGSSNPNKGTNNDATSEGISQTDGGTEIETGSGIETESGTETESEVETESETESETETESNPEDGDSEYKNFAIADVTDYVNVRTEPNTDCKIVGKLYDGAVAQILETVGEGDDQWFRITSGNVEGYIKAEFFIHGEAAAEVMEQYICKYVVCNVDELNVRKKDSISSAKTGYLKRDERVKLLEVCGEWLKIQYTSGIKAYVFAQYTTIVEEYTYAKSAEDEKKEQAFNKELEKRAGINKTDSTHGNTNVKPPSHNYASNDELRKAIVDYAMQFLGNRYINGGQSLVTGTDCSGFTMYVLREFGINISRIPQGQYTSAGRRVSYAEAKPGDIICYSGNGGVSCTHVAFYIGNGKILHAANSRDGVKISSATYTSIYAVKNVID